jgi:hypothetical protein
VQDVSRQVGVSGARSDPREHADILQAMKPTAQARVDEFYARLEQLGFDHHQEETP